MTIRVTIGRATVEHEGDTRISERGLQTHYDLDELLNATVRVLRAMGTEDAAEVIDRLDGQQLPPVAGTVRVHLAEVEGHDGPDYVILDDEDLRLAALAKLAGWQRMVTPAELDAEVPDDGPLDPASE